MATAAVTYTFTAGTTIVDTEIEANFADLVAFANNETVHKDGTVTMTGALTLPTAEPSGSNVAVRRKSAYRSCFSSHPSLDAFSVSGAGNGGSTSMGTLTNPFGYTPDYAYALIVLLTGTLNFSAAGGTVILGLESSLSPMGVIGPGSSQRAAYTADVANDFVSVCQVGIKSGIAATTVPTYTVAYEKAGAGTVTAYLTGMAFIVPSTRQLPN